MKSLLILGATSDIARAIAHQFASDHYDLVLAARTPDKLVSDVKDLEIRYGVQVTTVPFDVLDMGNHQTFFDSLDPIPDGVACAVGILPDQKTAEMDTTLLRSTFDTNLTGCVSILNIAANAFERRRSGFIIGISSVAGDRGRQSNYLYGAAKAGFSAYLSGMRNRLSKAGVHVMTVKPGFVRTRMTENMALPGALTAEPIQVAADIYSGLKRKKNIVYSRWFWRYIMMIIKHIPEFIFKRMNL